jgi:hypothetical protein
MSDGSFLDVCPPMPDPPHTPCDGCVDLNGICHPSGSIYNLYGNNVVCINGIWGPPGYNCNAVTNICTFAYTDCNIGCAGAKYLYDANAKVFVSMTWSDVKKNLAGSQGNTPSPVTVAAFNNLSVSFFNATNCWTNSVYNTAQNNAILKRSLYCTPVSFWPEVRYAMTGSVSVQ